MLAWEMKAWHLEVNNDSQLIVNQVKGEYQAKEEASITIWKR